MLVDFVDRVVVADGSVELAVGNVVDSDAVVALPVAVDPVHAARVAAGNNGRVGHGCTVRVVPAHLDDLPRLAPADGVGRWFSVTVGAGIPVGAAAVLGRVDLVVRSGVNDILDPSLALDPNVAAVVSVSAAQNVAVTLALHEAMPPADRRSET